MVKSPDHESALCRAFHIGAPFIIANPESDGLAKSQGANRS